MVKYSSPLITACFIKRLNRFNALVELKGEQVQAYVANSGRMRELLREGVSVYLQHVDLEHRRTKYDLLAVDYNGIMVSIDSRVPNQIMEHLVVSGEFEEFRNCIGYRRETTLGASRLDFFIRTTEASWFLETKSVTLVEEGVARFPDAPTERGRRHLYELAQYVADGGKGMAVFVIQRDDAQVFTPNDATDPLFGKALRQVAEQGVIIKAVSCHIDQAGITPVREIPVLL